MRTPWRTSTPPLTTAARCTTPTASTSCRPRGPPITTDICPPLLHPRPMLLVPRVDIYTPKQPDILFKFMCQYSTVGNDIIKCFICFSQFLIIVTFSARHTSPSLAILRYCYFFNQTSEWKFCFLGAETGCQFISHCACDLLFDVYQKNTSNVSCKSQSMYFNVRCSEKTLVISVI